MESTFTPTEWSTAQDKQEWLDKFVRFLERDCPASNFTKPLYTRLSMMFGHIAHYDRDGFYSVWFGDAGKRAEFTEYTLNQRIVGDPAYTWSDVERALQGWIRDNPALVTRYRNQARVESESNDFLLVMNILDAHGLEFVKRVTNEIQNLNETSVSVDD